MLLRARDQSVRFFAKVTCRFVTLDRLTIFLAGGNFANATKIIRLYMIASLNNLFKII
jgi:hypothetical protein